MIVSRSTAWAIASRTRRSRVGPSSMLSMTSDTRSVGVHSTFSAGSFRRLSALSVDRIRAMSARPVRTSAMRVLSSGTGCISTRANGGLPRQYPPFASSTTLTPCWRDTNLYGPLPTGCWLNVSPSFSTTARGTTESLVNCASSTGYAVRVVSRTS